MRPAQRAACTALAVAALAGPAAPASAAAPHLTFQGPRPAAHAASDHRLAGAVSGARLRRGSRRWLARDPGIGQALAVSPDGSRAFVSTEAASLDGDVLTVAHDTATGKRLWTAVFASPATANLTRSIAVSPDGTKVFVTGSARTGTTSAYATMAYDTADGTRLWAARYAGPASHSQAVSVAVSPHGAKVFVTGASMGRTGQFAYATLAYRAATGTRLWAARYTDGNRGAAPTGLAVSRTGQVYVSGTDRTLHGIQAYATVAYNPRTGHQLWLARYNGLGETNYDNAVTVTGTQVFVTGQSKNPATGGFDYATVAYSAATGKQRWTARYSGRPGSGGLPSAITAGPHGSEVVVTGGVGVAPPGGTQYATVAYRAATGTLIWARRYGTPPITSFNQATAVAFTPSHPEVIVTGDSHGNAATIAYRP